jgi:hypothetical protein
MANSLGLFIINGLGRLYIGPASRACRVQPADLEDGLADTGAIIDQMIDRTPHPQVGL